MKKIFSEFGKLFLLACYFIIGLVLIIEACTPGNVSADKSTGLGDKISDRFDIDFGDKNEYVKPENVIIEYDENKEYYIGDKVELNGIVSPENATNKTIIWSSDNQSIATVSSNGKVSLLKEGDVTITATIKDTDITSSIKINVLPILEQDIEFYDYENKIVVGTSIGLQVRFSPLNTTYKDIVWESSDPTIATVVSSPSAGSNIVGIVKAIKSGIVTITATSKTGLKKSATIEIIDKIEVPVTSLDIISPADMATLYVGRSVAIKTKVFPENATNKNVRFEIDSQYNDFVTVSKAGTVTGKKAETVEIKIISSQNENIYKILKLKIIDYPILQSFNLSYSDKMKVGYQQNIVVKDLTPSNAKVTKKTFESSNQEIAKVNNSGLIEALGIGKVDITCNITTTNDVIISKTITIEIVPNDDIIATDLEITGLDETIEMYSYYSSINLSKYCTILPSNTTNKNLIITSSNANIVKVSGTTISPQEKGTAIITITSASNKSLSKTIKVIVKYNEVKSAECMIDEQVVTEYEMKILDTVKLTYKYQVVNENIPLSPGTTFNWKSTDENIIGVDAYGQLVAYNEGTAYVELYSNRQAKAVTKIKIIVKRIKVESVEIIFNDEKIEYLEIIEGENLNLSYNVIPINATNKGIRFASTNTNIVEINQEGNVTCKTNGKAVIRLYSLDNSEIIQELTIVIKSKKANYSIGNEEIKDNKLELSVNKSLLLKINLIEMPSQYKLQFTSSNPSVAEVGSNGSITGKSQGTATIKVICISGDGDKEVKEFTVKVINEYETKRSSFYMLVRKGIGHFGAFLIFAVFGALFMIFSYKKKYIFMILSLVVGFLIASCTEIIQIYIPGRVGAFKDVLIDFTGYVAGTIFIFVFYYFIKLIKYFKERRKKNDEKQTDVSC